MTTVALATCLTLPEPDVDAAPLIAALEAAGLSVRLLPWDDVTLRPEPGELVVLRSTWNYYLHVDAFLAWIDQTSATNRLLNPAALVHRNARKTYLRTLDAAGIAIVPTVFAEKGSRPSVAEILRDQAWQTIVIKPVVSAASFLTRRFGPDDIEDAQRFLDELTTGRDAMVQRWIPAVETSGERSLVWIDGALTHAIRKSPRFTGGGESVSPEVPIADDERAFAERVLATLGPARDELLYARIDVIRDDEDGLRLMELELIEPSLFLQQCPSAAERLVSAICARAGSR